MPPKQRPRREYLLTVRSRNTPNVGFITKITTRQTRPAILAEWSRQYPATDYQKTLSLITPARRKRRTADEKLLQLQSRYRAAVRRLLEAAEIARDLETQIARLQAAQKAVATKKARGITPDFTKKPSTTRAIDLGDSNG